MNTNPLGRALRGIAQALDGNGRCDICRHWPPNRVVYLPPEEHAPPAVPEYCPVCGWRPLTIEVVYTGTPLPARH